MTCYVGVHKDEYGGHVTSVYTVTHLLLSLSLSTVPLDPTQPTVTVQIRLADGTRLVSKFNHTHTVNDIRQLICILRQVTTLQLLLGEGWRLRQD